jgi:hypothetical protein
MWTSWRGCAVVGHIQNEMSNAQDAQICLTFERAFIPFFYIFSNMGFELRVFCLPGKHSTSTSSSPPTLFALIFFR